MKPISPTSFSNLYLVADDGGGGISDKGSGEDGEGSGEGSEVGDEGGGGRRVDGCELENQKTRAPGDAAVAGKA